jgi:hypothetical protein
VADLRRLRERRGSGGGDGSDDDDDDDDDDDEVDDDGGTRGILEPVVERVSPLRPKKMKKKKKVKARPGEAGGNPFGSVRPPPRVQLRGVGRDGVDHGAAHECGPGDALRRQAAKAGLAHELEEWLAAPPSGGNMARAKFGYMQKNKKKSLAARKDTSFR